MAYDSQDINYAIDQLIKNKNLTQIQRKTFLLLISQNATYVIKAIGEANLSDDEIADLYTLLVNVNYENRLSIYSYFNKPSIRSKTIQAIRNLKGSRLTFLQYDYPTSEERELIIDSIYRDQDYKSAESLLKPKYDKFKYTIPEQHLKDKLEALFTMTKLDEANKEQKPSNSYDAFF